jgi:DNA-binding NarL/FixJ family response regulator
VEALDDELRVVLADEHPFFREGLREVLTSAGIAVIGEVSDYPSAVSLARKLSPDVVVIGLNAPDASGIESIRQITTSKPDIEVLVVAVSVDEGDVREALIAGASGYLLKDARASVIPGAVRQAAAGNAVLAGEVIRAFVARMKANNPAMDGEPALTARELDVLRLIAAGADNAAIGQALSISKHTVKQYVTNILEKLGVRTRVEAAVYAVRAGLA